MELADKKGTTRALDDLGRIVIPGEIREALGWGPGTKLEIFIQNVTVKSITIREASPRCSLCWQESDSLQKIEKGLVCPECAKKIG